MCSLRQRVEYFGLRRDDLEESKYSLYETTVDNPTTLYRCMLPNFDPAMCWQVYFRLFYGAMVCDIDKFIFLHLASSR